MDTNSETGENLNDSPPRPDDKSKRSGLKLLLELLVVFAGVTAGFLLNNWWTNRNDKGLEKSYYERFSDDIRSDINEMKRIYTSDSLWFIQYQWLNNEFDANRLTKANITNAAFSINGSRTADLKRTTFNDLTSTGNWRIITDKDLRKDLHVYYEEVSQPVKWLDDQMVQFYAQFFNPFAYKNLYYRKGVLLNFDAKLAHKVVNYYDFIYLFQRRRMKELSAHIKYSDELVARINSKL